jgi:hypothetical protein
MRMRPAMTDLKNIFSEIKVLMEIYRPPLVAKVEDNKRFDLVSVKDVVIEGRKRKELYFASIIIQKDFVGFYYMPVYSYPEMKALFQPELLKLLKGKSCFHIKRLDDQLRDQIRAALEDGFKLYQTRGWII